VRGVKICDSMTISHLLFVGDIFIFGHGSLTGLRSIREILNLYCKATGLEINMRKSSLLLSGVSENVKAQIEILYTMNVMELDHGIKYLGFTLKPNRYKYEEWLWFYNKNEARVFLWCN